MKLVSTELEGVVIIEPEIHTDRRGYFYELFSERIYRQFGIETTFVQDNYSLSLQKGTIRGMHYQLRPQAQSKLVSVLRGEILNVVVDIRKGSPTFGKWISVTISEKNHRQLFIPKGFANGLCTLAEKTEILYKVDAYYTPACDRAFKWNDPVISIRWPVESPILSDRDRNAPLFQNVDNNFIYGDGL